MCCIFTCCGWMIDLVQRAWVFAMSCCISSAVCCVLLTASMSGVALGYNYSLAEYIDLKETNVSVYLKRGVFDDDIAEEMDWRRSGGHKSIKGLVRDDGDLKTGAPDEENMPLRSGRRLDDSIMESDSQHKFEGSLMKLTAKPIHPLTSKPPVTSDVKMQEIFEKYPHGSLDQLKEIQSLVSMRKSEAARDTTISYGMKLTTYGQDERYVPHFPAVPDQGRRMMGGNGPGHGIGAGQPDLMDTFALPGINPARFAVPDSYINERSKWMGPKLPERKSMDYNMHRAYPSPIIYHGGPIRPTRPEGLVPTHTSSEKVATVKLVEVSPTKVIDSEMEDIKEKLILDKYESPRLNEQKTQKEGEMKSGFDYYEDDIKGLPVRRKRSNNVRKTKINNKGMIHEKHYGNKHLKLKEKSSPNKINHFPNHSVRKLLSFQNAAFESLKSEKNSIKNEQKPRFDFFEDESEPSVQGMNNIRVRRKNKRALHEKFVPETARKVVGNIKTNTNYSRILVGELLLSYNTPPRSSDETKSVNNINFTTDNIVNILRSMFS